MKTRLASAWSTFVALTLGALTAFPAAQQLPKTSPSDSQADVARESSLMRTSAWENTAVKLVVVNPDGPSNRASTFTAVPARHAAYSVADGARSNRRSVNVLAIADPDSKKSFVVPGSVVGTIDSMFYVSDGRDLYAYQVLLTDLIRLRSYVSVSNEAGNLELAIKKFETELNIEKLSSSSYLAERKDGVPLLLIAVEHPPGYSEETLNVLLKAGANVNAAAKDGVTALMAAQRKGRSDLVRILLASGARENGR